MQTLIIRFTTKFPPNIGSVIVARASGSKQFSHCMVVVNGRAFEASMTHGCRVVPVNQAMDGVAYYQDMEVPVLDLSQAVDFGLEQDGKHYDWLGALGIPFLASEDWADDSKWWCSELVFAMVMAGGNFILDPKTKKRVTPQDLLMLNFPKTEIKRWNACQLLR